MNKASGAGFEHEAEFVCPYFSENDENLLDFFKANQILHVKLNERSIRSFSFHNLKEIFDSRPHIIEKNWWIENNGSYDNESIKPSTVFSSNETALNSSYYSSFIMQTVYPSKDKKFIDEFIAEKIINPTVFKRKNVSHSKPIWFFCGQHFPLKEKNRFFRNLDTDFIFF